MRANFQIALVMWFYTLKCFLPHNQCTQYVVYRSLKNYLKQQIYVILHNNASAVLLHVRRQIRSWKEKITRTERPTTVFELILIWLHCSHMHTYCVPLVGRHSFPGHCPHSSNGMMRNQSEPRGGEERLHEFSQTCEPAQLLPSYGKRQLRMNNGLQPHWCLGSVVVALQRDQSYGCMYSRRTASQQWIVDWGIYL